MVNTTPCYECGIDMHDICPYNVKHGVLPGAEYVWTCPSCDKQEAFYETSWSGDIRSYIASKADICPVCPHYLKCLTVLVE